REPLQEDPGIAAVASVREQARGLPCNMNASPAATQDSRCRFCRRGRHEMRGLLATIAIAASFAFVENAQAQTYPSRPVTIVVPFPAGGPTHALARLLAPPI